MGDGYAGKTSLIRALHGEAVIPGHEPTTPGIEIREWPVPNSDIKAHLWDFGGQVMAHAMHKFFLREHCIYVAGQSRLNFSHLKLI
jgi:GTPase SAR1 family protein